MVESQPFAGDIYLANLDPTKGGEQAGTRPVIILSLHAFNIRSRPVIICPIASNMQPWATKIGLLQEMKTHGIVVMDQIRSIDREQRLHRKVEAVPKSFIILVRSYVGRLLDLEVPLSDL
jgi:mRNA interferase MazF